MGVTYNGRSRRLYLHSQQLGKHYPVVVMGRKPACWKYGVIGHLAPFCPKKASEVPPTSDSPRGDTIFSASPVMGRLRLAPVVKKPRLGLFHSPHSLPKKKSEEKQEWQVEREGISKLRDLIHRKPIRARKLTVPLSNVRLL